MHLPPVELREADLYIQMGLTHVSDPDLLRSVNDFTEPDFQQLPEFTADHNPLHNDDAISLDTRRLQAQHTTEGYRDGIIAGKAESIQAGFDEGFRLGAHVGLKAGRILGLLEGVAGALKESGLHSSARIDQLLSDAKTDLSIDSIFSEQYWTSDGNWRYAIKGSKVDSEILLEDIAGEHPVVTKWDKIIEQEIKRWDLDEQLPILGSGMAQTKMEDSAPTTQIMSRQAVDW
ncbi:hypothetical protein F5Y13DRAFT_80569 [Hypoxylon sp. FL1857]|nr:hypothetical protein F5Y13DRAFT_80569 [Hypoxylon sp. FL1857]